MRDKSKTQELLKAFRESRSQSTITSVEKRVGSVEKSRAFSKGYTYKKDPYSSFMDKYSNLEAEIDNFGAKDLVYFFREKAKEAGYKYVISNFARDGGVMKKVLTNYSSREICLMIEFLFNSEQDYLDKPTLSPTILSSRWCNTIYNDSMLWVEDKYIPKSKKSSKRIENREWHRDVDEEVAVIGDWEDD